MMSSLLGQFISYRKWRGGRWARITGWMGGYRWVRVGPICVDRVDEDWNDWY